MAPAAYTGMDIRVDDPENSVCPICNHKVQCSGASCAILACTTLATLSSCKVAKLKQGLNAYAARTEGVDFAQKAGVVAPCGHYYHAECLSNFLEHDNNCAVCRQPVTEDGKAYRYVDSMVERDAAFARGLSEEDERGERRARRQDGLLARRIDAEGQALDAAALLEQGRRDEAMARSVDAHMNGDGSVQEELRHQEAVGLRVAGELEQSDRDIYRHRRLIEDNDQRSAATASDLEYEDDRRRSREEMATERLMRDEKAAWEERRRVSELATAARIMQLKAAPEGADTTTREQQERAWDDEASARRLSEEAARALRAGQRDKEDRESRQRAEDARRAKEDARRAREAAEAVRTAARAASAASAASALNDAKGCSRSVTEAMAVKQEAARSRAVSQDELDELRRIRGDLAKDRLTAEALLRRRDLSLFVLACAARRVADINPSDAASRRKAAECVASLGRFIPRHPGLPALIGPQLSGDLFAPEVAYLKIKASSPYGRGSYSLSCVPPGVRDACRALSAYETAIVAGRAPAEDIAPSMLSDFVEDRVPEGHAWRPRLSSRVAFLVEYCRAPAPPPRAVSDVVDRHTSGYYATQQSLDTAARASGLSSRLRDVLSEELVRFSGPAVGRFIYDA